MSKRNPRNKAARLVILLIAASLIMAACNLGPSVPSEPVDDVIPQGEVTTTGTEDGGVAPPDTGATLTPTFAIPPTSTPIPDLLPAETLGPVTIDGTEHRVGEVMTIRVQRGGSVSTVTCNWVHQDTGQSASLGASTTNTINAETFEEVYTFTPEMAGTYAANCTGVALTTSGQRPVNATSLPFTVDAKG